MDRCYICEAELHSFMTTPILELPNGTYEACCETCANEQFPGWDDEESNGIDDEWIKVSEEQPDEDKFILVTDGEQTYPAYLSHWANAEKTVPVFRNIKNNLIVDFITHWMYPPFPPIKE